MCVAGVVLCERVMEHNAHWVQHLMMLKLYWLEVETF
jgi:hypothetical protein